MMKKKGVTGFIAFALLITFGVIVGSLIFKWSVGLTEKRAEDLQEKVYDRSACDYVSASIQSVCQDTQTLNINITNNNQLGITGLVVRSYSIYADDQPELREINITIASGESKRKVITKQGSKSRIEIIPYTERDGKIIVCRERSAAAENIPHC